MSQCGLCKHWRKGDAPARIMTLGEQTFLRVFQVGKAHDGPWGRCADMPSPSQLFVRERCGTACPDFQEEDK